MKFKLLPIIKDLNKILNSKLKKKKLNLYSIGIEKNSYIYPDILKFKQILYNLLEIAIKFTNKGDITFRGIEKRDHWKFQVVDTSLCIDIENYVAVFRVFERVEHYQKYHFHTKLIKFRCKK